MIVQDISRPDVGGIAPKMQVVADLAECALAGRAPYIKIRADDNLCSNVTVWGALEAPAEWANGIFWNATHFIADFTAPSSP
jgi:hypothetical protein